MKKKLLLLPILMFCLLMGNMSFVSANMGGAVATGDNTNITPYIILLVVALAVIVGLFVYKKKNKK